MSSGTATRAVAVIGLPGVQTLDVVGPMEVFAVANQHRRQQEAYRVILGTADGEPLQTHAGLSLGPATALRDMPDDLDTVVVAGGSEAAMRAAVTETGLVPWLQQRAIDTRRVASVCTGAFILAAAGLLDDRRATTHWNSCALLGSLFPRVRVEPDAIFVAEPPVYTSAGVSAGIDLCLALVEADLGAPTALAVARELVLFLRRPGGQSQFSAGLDVQVTAESRLHRLVTEVMENPGGDLSVAALAERAGMSERSFSRRFRREVGTAPAQFVEAARLARAKSLLETSDWPIERVAERAGFGSADGLQRAFQKHLGITPREYRERFCVSAQASP
ncbi:MAG TPA: helix-turn-helix domain-containing protein [Devosiaceae bacterium]|nr:helix-turn-helix domain-containing protein [Devosiaceae bacterium]